MRLLQTASDLQDVQTMERVVWGNEPIPLHQTLTVARNGGIILGAYEGEKIVGFNYGFPGYSEGRVFLCSHMTGVIPDYQNQGLGRLLKEEQRKIALEKGYTLIRWTFDPLISLNAYLNLHKLRAIAAMYSVNHYGEMQDDLNRGLPSDRFTADWWITAKHVDTPAHPFAHLARSDEHTLLPVVQQANGLPAIPEVPADLSAVIRKQEAWFVPIPANFQRDKQIDPDWALDWRLKTRQVFQALTKAGFVGADVRKADTNEAVCYYLFVPRQGLAIP